MSITTGHYGASELPERRSIIERAGENPLRFLNMSEADTALGVIRGINDLDRLEARREAELTGETPTPTETVEPDPEPEPEPEPAVETTPSAHPETDLEPGDVLVVDRGLKTEFIFPTTDASEKPYLSRAYNNSMDSLWMELEIDGDDLRARLEKDHRQTTVEEIDVDAPASAALGGGA